MFQFNYIHKHMRSVMLFLFIVFTVVFILEDTAYAAIKIDHYSYNNIKNNLPKELVNEQYLFKSDNIAYIAFATYKGNDYKTSVKRTTGQRDYLYCMDYSKHIDFAKEYAVKNSIFNNKLRAKLAVAFHYGASTFKGLADSKFTTGNTMLDYYMTQLVVHALIYKYGDSKSNYGIDYSQISFKDNTGSLKKKTNAFYEFCCDATVYESTTDFHKYVFNFKEPDSVYMYINGDVISTPDITCKDNNNNAPVKSYTRNILTYGTTPDIFSLVQEGNQYNSPCKIQAPVSAIDQLSPGLYAVSLAETVNFYRYLSAIWQSTDSTHVSQEVGGPITETTSTTDSVTFSLSIGNVVLHKKDSISGKTIPDAVFALQQYNNLTGQYEFYKHLIYNDAAQQYESGNIYRSGNNPKGYFRIIEERPGEHYINDWEGATFQLTNNNYYFEFNVENSPILGELAIHKTGEKPVFSENGFAKEGSIALSGVKFGLYAGEDIYFKGVLTYHQDQKIVDLVTDSSGMVKVQNLLSGKYYFKEEETNPLYELDPAIHSFSIQQDSSGKYSKVNFELLNTLKSCQLQVLKYNEDASSGKQPLSGAGFGLYASTDIKDALGHTVISKDQLIKKAITGEDGYIHYENLLYGDYYIKELEAPKGYILNDGIIPVSREEFKQKDNSKVFYCHKEIVNQKQIFNLHILKTGESFADFSTENSELGEYVRYELKPAPLKNVEFSLYNRDTDAFIAKAVTDEQGMAKYDNIEFGNYYAMETAVPEEYEINPEKIYFECDIDSNTYNPVTPPVLEASMTNTLCRCTIALKKLGEHVKLGKKELTYDEIPLAGIVFGVYQDFEYTFPSGEKLPKNTCVGYILTDEEGNGRLSTKLPVGKYYLKELKTNTGYDLDTNLYSFEIKGNHNQEIAVQTDNHNQFTNRLSKASVKIIKTDAGTGKRLKNVEFTLYNNMDKPIGSYKTNHKGEILVENLPYGEYYFIETRCKNGYYSNNDKYRFTLASSETVVLHITNNPILKLGFSEYYKEGLIFCLILLSCLVRILYYAYGKK